MRDRACKTDRAWPCLRDWSCATMPATH